MTSSISFLLAVRGSTPLPHSIGRTHQCAINFGINIENIFILFFSTASPSTIVLATEGTKESETYLHRKSVAKVRNYTFHRTQRQRRRRANTSRSYSCNAEQAWNGTQWGVWRKNVAFQKQQQNMDGNLFCAIARLSLHSGWPKIQNTFPSGGSRWCCVPCASFPIEGRGENAYGVWRAKLHRLVADGQKTPAASGNQAANG